MLGHQADRDATPHDGCARCCGKSAGPDANRRAAGRCRLASRRVASPRPKDARRTARPMRRRRPPQAPTRPLFDR
ncbi:hypothetical protein WJ28_25035 [Burkholderia thailandensis]|nr:hypothetical protein WJ27_14520 [Burkholderia thailandensis]KVG15226.1 hypothetical protein WJ25_26685 [Burkholderia thailandensis]KVG21394.1 hypothetical protein WJ28_25035 [Burkholderia thailandensis]